MLRWITLRCWNLRVKIDLNILFLLVLNFKFVLFVISWGGALGIH